MALDDNGVFIASTARFYTAPTGTAAPTDLLAPEILWEEMGHTSIDSIMPFESEGGDKETKGTLQKRQIRTTRSDRTDTFRVDLQQFDQGGQKLYHGSNATFDAVSGMVQVPTEPIPTTCAFLMVAVDGVNALAVHAPKAEIFRADNIDLGDTESIATLPLEVTPLQHAANTWAYQMSALAEV